MKKYYSLAKPGLVYGNLIPLIGGFALASRGITGAVDWPVLAAALVGLALVMASACVFNNYIDRGIDAAMARTKERPLVTGAVSARAALVFGSVLGAAGFAMLYIGVNAIAGDVAAAGFLAYIFLYSAAKRATVHGSLVGSLAGAVPPVVGYAAAAGRLDPAAGILFLIMVFWQMPHFLSIAIYRAGDYAAAGIPVYPVARGMQKTKALIVAYAAAFAVVAPSPYFIGAAGPIYGIIAAVLGIVWLVLAVRLYFARDGEEQQARLLFFASLAVMVLLFAAIAIGP